MIGKVRAQTEGRIYKAEVSGCEGAVIAQFRMRPRSLTMLAREEATITAGPVPF